MIFVNWSYDFVFQYFNNVIRLLHLPDDGCIDNSIYFIERNATKQWA